MCHSEKCNKYSDSLNGGEFLGKLNDYKFRKRKPVLVVNIFRTSNGNKILVSLVNIVAVVTIMCIRAADAVTVHCSSCLKNYISELYVCILSVLSPIFLKSITFNISKF